MQVSTDKLTCPTGCWLNGNVKGVNFINNVKLPHVSYATLHVYPGEGGLPSECIFQAYLFTAT